MNTLLAPEIPTISDKRRRRVLVIDDETAYTFLLKISLEETGEYEVRTCNNPDEAIAIAVEFQPEVILLDVVMPSKDGGDLCNEIESHPALNKIPVIMVTALVSNREVSETGMANIGGIRMMAKPVTTANLHHCLGEVLTDR